MSSVGALGDAQFLPGLRFVNRRHAPPVEEEPLLERPTIRTTTPLVSLWEREAITTSGS